MKLIEAFKDATGYHFDVLLDDGTTVRHFDYAPLPQGENEANWLAMQKREIKALLNAGQPSRTNLPGKGADL